MTKSQINKLGERLRKRGVDDQEAFLALQKLRATYLAPLVQAQAMIDAGLGLTSTSRLKTATTIVEKLQREKTRLAEMQDIAGLRIVRDFGLSDQAAMADKIVRLSPGARIVDRRASPSYGYRALHVICDMPPGRLVEVQIRTKPQDLWAQATEKFADKFGSGIKYGERPPGSEALPDGLGELSKRLARVEEGLELTRWVREEVRLARERLKGLAPHVSQEQVLETEKRIRELETATEETRAAGVNLVRSTQDILSEVLKDA